MTQEEYKAMEMERMAKMNAAPLSNQVFKPVQVTNVPPPPKAQEPQITPQQQQPGIGQQFGQALATKMITKGVDAVTGLPIMSTIFAKRGKEVEDIEPLKEEAENQWAKYRPEPRPMPPIIRDPMGPRRPGPSRPGPTFPPIGPLASADFPVAHKNFDLQALPPRLQTEYLMGLERGMPHQDLISLFYWRALHGNSTDPSGTISRYNEGGDVGPLAQSQDEINKWYQEMYDKPHDPDNLDDPYLDNIRDLIDPDDPMLMAQNQGVVFDLHVLPPRLRSEYIQRLKSGMGHDEIIRLFESRAGKPRDYMQGTIQRYNEGGDVTYAQTGSLASVRAPLAKPAIIDREEPRQPTVTTIWDQFNSKGMPKQLHVPAANPQVSPSKESYWQKAERTGLFGVPGTNNVYVDPGKGTVAYQREDVKPFTWMWNKGRNFLGFGAPLAGGSE